MHNLAFVLSLEGRYAEAEKLDREALDLRRRVLGPEHPATLATMRDLSVDLSRERRYAEAEKLVRDRSTSPATFWGRRTSSRLRPFIVSAASKLAREIAQKLCRSCDRRLIPG